MALTRYRDVNDSSTSSEYSENATEEITSKKLCFLFTCLFLLGLVCLANSLVLAVMYQVLDIDFDSMSSVKFLKLDSEGRTRWVLDTDFEHILLTDEAEVYGNTQNGDIDLSTSNGQNLTLTTNHIGESSIKLTPFGTQMSTGHFEFVDFSTGKSILDFNNNKKISLHAQFDNKSLETNAIHTNKIFSSDKENPLEIAARDGGVFVTANKEISFNSEKAINFFSDQDVHFLVKNSNKISIGGNMKLNTKRMPNSKSGEVIIGAERYRLCACTKSGLLFRAKMENEMMTCAIARENPCIE